MSMNKIDKNSVVELYLQVNWRSAFAKHTDCYKADQVNIWRDTLPSVLQAELMDKQSGDTTENPISAKDLIAAGNLGSPVEIRRSQFSKRGRHTSLPGPRVGRFYPKGVLTGLNGIFSENMQPFRLVAADNGRITVDLSHPMSDREVTIRTTIGNIAEKGLERGGTSVDWIERLLEGPGMQARWMDTQTDFFSDDPFVRQDEKPDAIFYGQPRLVRHLDDTATEMVENTYARFLKDGMQVLDLMSSWQSNVPTRIRLDRLTGLGLNQAELHSNRQLTDFLVHDLNQSPGLPIQSNIYDVVLCTVSVEYLTDPVSVFQEVARVLRPQGTFVLTFSNRWFPTKAVRIWHEIHPFERMGLVLEYFIRSGRFKDLQTYSIRGLPRPRNDKYYPEMLESDPVFAVWGHAI